MQYVRSLEHRVKTLEEEKRILCQTLCSAGISPEQERPPGWDLVDPVRLFSSIRSNISHCRGCIQFTSN